MFDWREVSIRYVVTHQEALKRGCSSLRRYVWLLVKIVRCWSSHNCGKCCSISSGKHFLSTRQGLASYAWSDQWEGTPPTNLGLFHSGKLFSWKMDQCISIMAILWPKEKFKPLFPKTFFKIVVTVLVSYIKRSKANTQFFFQWRPPTRRIE